MSTYDVVVIGGGPGGSVTSTCLAQAGLSVLLLEKEHFPRFHLGESLLPQSLPILEKIGVLDAVKEQFIWKYGARFHDDIRNRKDRFCFADAWKADPIHAFQVERSKFDHVLLRNAAAKGVEVREGWSVERAIKNDNPVVGVVAVAPDGHKEEILAKRTVVDATGRDALFAHDHHATSKIEGLEQTAIFAHYENVTRQSGKDEGDIDVVLFRSSEEDSPNWFWIIPFKDGVTSVGAVVSKKWIRENRGDGNLTSLLDTAIAQSPSATALMKNAKRMWPEARSAADFSYRVGAIHGPGWVAVGDAAGFIDPLFSTGAHLAMTGGKLAAEAILEGTPEAFVRWEKSLRYAAETFIVAVRCFYTGPLVDMLFVQDKHVALRRSITSLLAGDVFNDSIWLRDARLRLSALIPGA